MEQNLNQNPVPIQPQPSNKFPTWAIVLISVLVTGIAVASGTYYFLNRDKNLTNNQPQPTSQQTESPLPSNTKNGNQVSDGFVYMKSLTDSPHGQADIIVSNFDGSTRSKIQTVPKYVGPLDDNDVSETGKIVYSTFSDTGESILVSDKGATPRNILILPQGKSVESTKISPDGQKIVYSLLNWGNNNFTEQLWVMNADGADNKMIIDDTGRYIVEQGPFRLAPLAWSKDKTKVYMITTTDSEATPRGMYVADLATAKIQKAKTPNVTLWGLSFSPDRTKIAYTTFEWKDVPDSFPEAEAPFTISVTDLNTGATEKILESQADQYSDPVWSPDGKKIMYKIAREFVEGGDAAILVVDASTKKTSVVVQSTKNTRMGPWAWLSNDRVIYTEESYTTGQIQNKVTTYLFTIKIDGTNKQSIDSARDMIVFDSLK
jgi:Tol biopolymer transport system component